MALLTSLPAQSGTRVLDRIEVRSTSEGLEIHVTFNEPLRYTSHFPDRRSEVLQVDLRPVRAGDQEAGAREEVLTWTASAEVPLLEVSYDATTGQTARLTLSFSRLVDFRVEGDRDLRGVTIVLAQSEAQPETAAPDDGDAGAPPSASADLGGPGTPGAAGGAEGAEDALPEPPPEALPEPAEESAERPDELPEVDLSKPFAIELLATSQPLSTQKIPELDVFREHLLYNSRVEQDGRSKNRVRLGFFASGQEAEAVVAQLRARFPEIIVIEVSEREREVSVRNRILPRDQPELADIPWPPPKRPQTGVGKAEGAPAVALPSEKFATLMQDARTALTAGDHRRAIQLLTKVLQSPEHEASAEAKELLGLARERNGQLAHAKAEYEEYLEKYPKGEGADRVRQRLAGVLTARAKPQPQLRDGEAQEEGEGGPEWNVYGSISQFYRRDQSLTDEDGNSLNQSELTSDTDTVASLSGERYEASVRVTNSEGLDFSEGGIDLDPSVSNAYAEIADNETAVTARLGRQSRSSDGVLGRFDGGVVSYQVAPEVQVNALGGTLVERSSDLFVDDDRHFAGLSLDLGTFWDFWDFNVFFTNQIADGLTDRRAVGGEARYVDSEKSAFLLVDFDAYYKSLNTVLFSGNWIFPDQSSVNIAADYRNSPILTTTNAIQGQAVNSLSGLQNNFSSSDINELAEDRTAVSKSFTIGGSTPLDSVFQLSGDFTVTDFSETESSGGVEGTPGTGPDFFYNLQLIGSGIVKEGDIGIVALRYSDTSTSNRYTIDFNTRYPIDQEFRISPRLRLEYRENDGDNGDELIVLPSTRLNYYWDRNTQFELEFGSEWLTEFLQEGSEGSLGYFISVGYRIDY